MITDDTIANLLRGFSPFGRKIPESELRAAWASIGDALTATHIEHHPGSRPWGWWKYSASEPRRCVNQVHPFDDPVRRAIVDEVGKWPDTHEQYRQRMHATYFGRPAALIPRTGDFTADYESETEYLDRLDLLTDEERAALAVASNT